MRPPQCREKLRRAGARVSRWFACEPSEDPSERSSGEEDVRKRRSLAQRRKALKRLEPHESIEPGMATNLAGRVTDSDEVRSPEDESRVERSAEAGSGRTPTPRQKRPARPAEDERKACDERQEGCGRREAPRLRTEGKALKGRNPTSVTGMKQGRTDSEGARRQEGEKPWRRKGVLPWKAVLRRRRSLRARTRREKDSQH